MGGGARDRLANVNTKVNVRANHKHAFVEFVSDGNQITSTPPRFVVHFSRVS